MSERLTVPWHKEQHSRADHAAPRLRARGHLHAVGRVEFLHFNKSPSGICMDLYSLSEKAESYLNDFMTSPMWNVPKK